GIQHAQCLARFRIFECQQLQRRRLAPGQLHGETLAGECMAILDPGVADRRFGDARPLRDPARNEGGVERALLDRQQQVLAGAAGLERIDLLDDEVFRRLPDTRLQHRRAVRARQPGRTVAHAATSRQAASATMPSPRPVKPSRSLVVALTPMSSTSTPRSAAITSRMAWAGGPILGPPQATVPAALPT